MGDKYRMEINNTNPLFKDLYLDDRDVISDMISSMCKDLNTKLETYIIEGLKRKGFEFKTRVGLDKFVIERCRCEDYFDLKQRTYFVDDTPFFFNDYNTEIDLTPISEDGCIKMNASYGTYSYL